MLKPILCYTSLVTLLACGAQSTTDQQGRAGAVVVTDKKRADQAKDQAEDANPTAFGMDKADWQAPIQRYDELEGDAAVHVRGDENSSSYTVRLPALFDPGSTMLNASGKTLLNKISASLAQRYPNGIVEILIDGSSQPNAMDQAAAVKEYMLSTGQLMAPVSVSLTIPVDKGAPRGAAAKGLLFVIVRRHSS